MRPAAAVRSTCSSARPTAITTSTIGRSRVACLLDGADGAGALLAEGARRAADGGSSLSLIYVDVSLLTPLVCLDGFVWIPDPDAVEADVRGWLGELAMQYPQAEAVFLRGDPATEVAAWAESQRPEVLLVGRRGGRLRRLLLGDRSPACAEARAARLLRSAWTRQPGGHPPGLNAGRASRPLTQHCDRRARKIDRMVKLLNHQALLLGLDLRRSEPTGDVMFILDVPWREGRHGGRRPRRRRARAAGGVRRSPWPTTTTPASPPTSTPAIWSGPCAWAVRSRRAWSRSTAAESAAWRPPLAASATQGSATAAGRRGSRSTSSPATSRSGRGA